MQRIADTRIESAEEADQAMARIAKIETTIELEKARANSKIATIKEALTKRIAELEGDLSPFAAALSRFILANRGLFKRTRKRKTEAGSYGLQDVQELVVEDEAAMMKALREGSFEGCIKVVSSPVKTEIAKLLKAGIELEGCCLKSGETAVYKTDPQLIKAAREVLP